MGNDRAHKTKQKQKLRKKKWKEKNTKREKQNAFKGSLLTHVPLET